MPLVSVIVIFFNAERFISEAIDSVFAQSYENWELLMVDDGSTDRSGELAKRLAEQHPGRVRSLEHDGRRNLGMSASRNLGIREARGEYVAFLDADDLWLPEKLERQVSDLESNPEAAMAYGPAHYWFSWTGKPEDRQRDFVCPLGIAPGTLIRPPALLTICHPLGEAPSAATCSLLLRRSVLDRIGGFEDSFRGLYEDQAFLAKVYLQETVFLSGDCLAKYRMHPDSSVFTTLNAGQHDRGRHSFLNWLEGYLRAREVTDDAIRKALDKALWPYRHPVLHRCSELSRQVAKWVQGQRNKISRIMRNRTASIEAHPNPILESGPFADRFLIGSTTLSWSALETIQVEVRVDAPNGPLLSRTAGSGSATTGSWVRDGMAFYLQDVSDRKPLISENTLDVITVRVARKPEESRPGVGRIRFGSLRRLTPISTEWGFDRGLPIDRFYIEAFLSRHARYIRGRVLEVGDSAYTRRFGGDRVAQSDVLNLEENIPGTTIVGDLTYAPQIPSDAFDCVILTQTLQYIYDVRAAVRTLFRILRRGGVLLATLPAITQTYDRKWGEHWCWNFTVTSARRLCEEVFPATNVHIEAFGNALAAVCILEGIASEELRPEELDYRYQGYEVTIAVRAVKPEEQA